jgi:ribose transport system permease protein
LFPKGSRSLRKTIAKSSVAGIAERLLPHGLTQQGIVLALAGVLLLVFSLTLDNFFTAGNLLALLRSVSVLGILGIGMALTVIGRGIDLSIVSVMAFSTAWGLILIHDRVPPIAALLAAAGLAALIGLVNGVLIAYVEIPALFTTLAMGTVVAGFGRFKLVPYDYASMPAEPAWLAGIGGGYLGKIPTAIVAFAVVLAVAGVFLRYVKFSRFIYAIGDNPAAARITGIPVRRVILMQYVLASLVGLVAGVVMAGSVAGMNTRIVITTLVYDVILVVVIGGVGLSGGKGGVFNVLVGTILIGIFLNGMTIMNISYTAQNILKGILLLIAILIDSILNPRNEQTEQQGDI